MTYRCPPPGAGELTLPSSRFQKVLTMAASTISQTLSTQRTIAVPLDMVPSPSSRRCSAGRCRSSQRRASCQMQPRQSSPLTAARRPQLRQQQQPSRPSGIDQALPRRRLHRGGRQSTRRPPIQPRHGGGGSQAAAQQPAQRPWCCGSAGNEIRRGARAEISGAKGKEDSAALRLRTMEVGPTLIAVCFGRQVCRGAGPEWHPEKRDRPRC